MITDYKHLPVGKYLDIIAIPRDTEQLDYQVRVVAILNDMSDDDVLDLPLPRYKELAAAADFLTAPVLKDGRNPFDGKNVPTSYTLGGQKMKLTVDPSKMTVAQYVDFQTFAKQDAPANLPLVLSCILVPEGKQYNEGYDVAEVHALIRDTFPVYDAFALSAFFLRKWLHLMRVTLTSSLYDLQRKKNKTPKEMELMAKTASLIRSMKNGDGLPMWTQLAKQSASRGTTFGV